MNFWRSINKPILGLSPMDGVTDAAFRFIAGKHGGPDVTLTEFVNTETALFAPHTLIKDLTYSEIERPVVAQIYGHTPQLFYQVAHLVCELGFDGLDINMGCPAKKVAAKGSGAALIREPELARAIIRSARQGIVDWCRGQTLSDIDVRPDLIRAVAAANQRRHDLATPRERRVIPVSVKTRIGYDKVVVEDWVRALLQEQPAAISVHGRTLKQGYKGNADWGAIARAAAIAEGSETLIMGNGDLQDLVDVCRRVRETGVDGVLLGRSAQGNPWIFRAKDAIKQALRLSSAVSGSAAPVSLEERFGVMLEHSRYFEQHWGRAGFVGMRKHLAWYCKSLPRATELRSRLVRVRSVSEVIECLHDYAAWAVSDRDAAEGSGDAYEQEPLSGRFYPS
jgi:tRNA-dihydrouridine synthase